MNSMHEIQLLVVQFDDETEYEYLREALHISNYEFQL